MRWLATIFLVLVLLLGRAETQAQVLDPYSILDLSCVDLQVQPPGSCWQTVCTGVPPVCFPVPATEWQYYLPGALIETVNKPGDSVFDPYKPAIIAATAVLPLPGGKIFGTGVAGDTPVPDEKFQEAHVIEPYPPLIPLPCGAPPTLGLTYLSEVDFLNWRGGVLPPFLNFDILTGTSALAGSILAASPPIVSGAVCALTSVLPSRLSGFNLPLVGCWGPLYPRQGRAFQASDIAGSALLGYRALHYASYVLKTTGMHPSLADRFQPAYPTASSCVGIGESPVSWQAGLKQPGTGGKYLWVFWKYFSCCVGPGGITDVTGP